MPQMQVLESSSTDGGLSTPRCLELRPVLDRMGLTPIVIGVGRVLVGSGPNVDARIAVEGVSEQHAEIHFDGRQARVKVLSPLTWLNDGPVREALLRSGDILTLGPVEFRAAFVEVAPPPPVPAAASAAPSPATALPPTAPAETASKNLGQPQSARRQSLESLAPAVVAKSRRAPAAASKPVDGSSATGSGTVNKSTTTVQPWLEEARAAKNLKHDLERVEREAAWYEAHLGATPGVAKTTSAPAIPIAPALDQLASREQALAARELQLDRTTSDLAKQQGVLRSQESALQTQRGVIDAERAELKLKIERLADEQAALVNERGSLQQASEQLRQQQVSITREREQLQSQRDVLDAARAEHADREQALVLQQSEFDSAVAALDLDREQLRRDREAAERDQTQARKRLEVLRAELSDREAELEQQRERLQQQVAELETRELALEQQGRESALSLRTREIEFARREAALRSRETSLSAQAADLDSRTRRHEDATLALANDRAELDVARDELARVKQGLERAQREVAADRERVRAHSQSLTQQTERSAAEWERLQVAQAEIEQSRGDLEVQLRQLAVRDEGLRQQLTEIESTRREHAALASAWSLREQELNSQLAALAEKYEAEQASAASVSQLIADQTRLANLETELELRREQLEQSERELAALRQECSRSTASTDVDADLQAELSRLQIELQTVVQERDSLATEVRSIRESVALNGEIEAALAERVDALDAREVRVSELEAALANAKSSTAREQETLAAAHAREASRLQALAADLVGQGDQLTAERDALEQLRSALDAECEQLAKRVAVLDEREALLHVNQAEVEDRQSQCGGQPARELGAVQEELLALREVVAALTADRDRLLDERARLVFGESLPASAEIPLEAAAAEIFADHRSVPCPSNAWSAADEARSWMTREPNESELTQADANETLAGDDCRAQAMYEELASAAISSHAVTEDPAEVWDDETGSETATEFRRSEGLSHSLPSQRHQGESESAGAQPTSPEASAGIRSQLAMLFGISSSELEATAARHARDDADRDALSDEYSAVEHERRLARAVRSAAPAPVEPGSAASPVAAPAFDPQPAPSLPQSTGAVAQPETRPQGEDSVAAYMQRLLANATFQASPPQSQPLPTSSSPEQEAPAPCTRSVESVGDASSDPNDDPAAKSRGNRRLDKQDIAEMRANIDSMRQIANLSARSAVARHYASKLEVAYKVKLALTGVAGGMAALLLTAEFWTSNSYRMPGICCGVVALIAGIELARTTLQMRRVRQIAGMHPGQEEGTPANAEPSPSEAS